MICILQNKSATENKIAGKVKNSPDFTCKRLMLKRISVTFQLFLNFTNCCFNRFVRLNYVERTPEVGIRKTIRSFTDDDI